MTSADVEQPKSILPYAVGVPVGAYAGVFVAFIVGMLSTWVGVFWIPAFVITTVVSARFIARQIREFQRQQFLRERAAAARPVPSAD